MLNMNFLNRFKNIKIFSGTFASLDWPITITLFFLSIFSISAIYPISEISSQIFFIRQIVFFILGFLVMFLLFFIDFNRFKNQTYIFAFLYIFALILLFLPFLFGDMIRGSKSWISIGEFNMQPTEYVKIILLLVFAKYFSFRQIELYKPFHIIISAIYVATPAFIIALMPDLGSALVILSLWLGMVIISGIRLKHLLIVFLIGAMLVTVLWGVFLEDYQKTRVLSFIYPYEDPLGASYSRNQALIAIGGGSIFGTGFGNGAQTIQGFLPESHTDFIFANIAENTGLIGITIVLFLFGFIIWRLLHFQGKNSFANAYSLGLGILILFQALINILINIGMLPVTGITLPFLSYGGSSLISLFIAIGIYQGFYSHS